MRLSLGFGIFLSVLVAAFAAHFFTLQKYGGKAYRHPAAINPNVLDLNPDEVVDSNSKRRILAGAKLWKENGNVGVVLGHFLAKGLSGETSQLCELYPTVALTFSADGVAVSGTRPTLSIESPCVAGGNSQQTETIWIPVDQIQKEKPSDIELRVSSDVFVRARDIPGDWPTYWTLTEIKFLDKKDGRSILIDTPTIYKLSSTPLTISWN